MELTPLQEQEKANSIKNQIKKLTDLKKWLLHIYIGHEKHGTKSLFNEIPNEIIIIIKQIDILISKLEKGAIN